MAVATATKIEQDTLVPPDANKLKFAQYFTPSSVAKHMVELFEWSEGGNSRILDPGAGDGSLILQVLKYLQDQELKPSALMVEVDSRVCQQLKENSEKFNHDFNLSLVQGDFLNEAFRLKESGVSFSHIIINPPYFKLQRNSNQSEFLLKQGVNVTNMYAAFIWLSALLLEDDGQLVAIIPRSFCNGPYFLRFREFIARNLSIESIHIFESRNSIFSGDRVLQENIIIKLTNRNQAERVRVTYSNDQTFSDIKCTLFPVAQVLSSEQTGFCISIPEYGSISNIVDYAAGDLASLGISVSTGPVVSFRHTESISNSSSGSNIPLLFPGHMKDGKVNWPAENLTKRGQFFEPKPDLWNAVTGIMCDKNVSPAKGYYVAVRRFSSKEEVRRIKATVVDASCLNPRGIAFENSLNYFHQNKSGFDRDLAYGLAGWLNSEILDKHFRSLSGHTQVNATDLRNMPYPSIEQLRNVGRIVLENFECLYGISDSVLMEVLA